MLAGLIILTALATAALVYWLATGPDRSRAAVLRPWAAEQGLGFGQQAGPAQGMFDYDFELFTCGSRKLQHPISGAVAGTEMAIFDYRSRNPENPSDPPRSQTVLCLRAPGLALPDFSLRPENVADKIREQLGAQDIDFPEDPAFSKHYLLRGGDEEAVRGVFLPEVRQFFEDRQGLCAETRSDRLLLYRPGQVMAPDGLRTLLDEAGELLQKLPRQPEASP